MIKICAFCVLLSNFDIKDMLTCKFALPTLFDRWRHMVNSIC